MLLRLWQACVAHPYIRGFTFKFNPELTQTDNLLVFYQQDNGPIHQFAGKTQNQENDASPKRGIVQFLQHTTQQMQTGGLLRGL